jgi:putative ABC transport system substrate-binding protein
VSRRDFIFLFGAATLSAPSVARAQEPGRTYRLALVFPFSRGHPNVATILDELRRHGFLEGVNLSNVGALGVPMSKLEPTIIEAAKASPDVIIAGGGWMTRIWQRATRTIPIVTVADDLVRENLVGSFARPEGNTTGISLLAAELDGKRQELLMEMLPDARRIGRWQTSTPLGQNT